MFHVKPHQSVSSVPTGVGKWVAACLAMGGLVMAPAQAGVQKCTAADGKVVFSDQPCPEGQASSSVRGVPEAKPMGGGTRDQGSRLSYEDAVQRARRAEVHAALSPVCRALGDKASRAVRSDASSLEEVKQAVSQFESQCGDQVLQASVRNNTTRAVPNAADCRALRKSLEDQRARMKTMTNKELQEFAKFQNEVSVGCR